MSLNLVNTFIKFPTITGAPAYSLEDGTGVILDEDGGKILLESGGADIKVSALTENVTPVLVDLLATVDDPSGTPLSKKVTIGNVLSYSGKRLLIEGSDSSTPFDMDWGSNGGEHDIIEAYFDIGRASGSAQYGLRIDDEATSEYEYDERTDMIGNTSGTTTSIIITGVRNSAGTEAVHIILQRMGGGDIAWYAWTINRDSGTWNIWSMGRKQGHTGGFTKLSVIAISGLVPQSIGYRVYGYNKK